MINGHLSLWAHEYLPTFMAAASMVTRPLILDVSKMLVVALLSGAASSWLTTQLALTRLEESAKSVVAMRDKQIANRDQQIAEMKANINLIESYVKTVRENQIEVITRLNFLERILQHHVDGDRRK